MDSAELAQRCREERNNRDLTQEQVARRVEASKQAVSKAENYTERDGMDRFRVRVLEELTGDEVNGPLWEIQDDPE